MLLRSSSYRLSALRVAALLVGLFVVRGSAGTNLSAWVYPGSSGRLIGQPDALGNRVVDGSGAGYRSGLLPLPSSNMAPVKVTISPVAGDNTANIQNAINQVAAMPMNSNGFRGAVLLTAGEYPCATSININASGVVLRGVGSFTNGSGTVLRATASNQYSLVRISGSGSASTSTTHNITNNYVPVGARSFNVDSTSGFAVGDRVYVRRYTTTNWIHDIGMDLLTNIWTPSEYTVNMDRTITRLEGNRVFIDDSVTCAIDAHYTNGALVKFTWNGRITNSGIEHIYGKSDFFGNSTNENHGWIFVQFNSIEHGFARDVISQYFGYACVALFSGSKHVTVADCQCLDPVSIVTGGRRYAFVMDDDTLCVVKNCYTRQDRHQYVTQSMTTGPNVFVDSVSDNARAEAGPHHRWATAGIWDKVIVNGHDLDVQNTCESGTGHGWEGANCVIWNSKANSLKVSSPPTARNWLIGSVGSVSKGGDCHGIVSQNGTWDSSGASGPNVFPDSLYFGQLQDRLAAPNLRPREYWLGVIDGFSNSIPRDTVDLNPTWSNAVQAAASGQPLDPFNVVAGGHWIPFTFNYAIGATDQVVGATLSVAMRANASAAGDVLYVGSTTNAFTFSSLGWLPIGTGTNTTVRVVDLVGQLNLLTNGQLNVAVQGDAGIDWAMLELAVAPALKSNTNAVLPVADATVRAGTSGNINFGTAATLTVKNDSATNNFQQAYLRWDLSGVTQSIVQARVSLTPVSVGTNGIEQGARVASSNAWSEAGITFNNQPGAGERFATWIPGTNAVTFDVTSQVLDALNNDKQLSLEVYSVRNVGSAGTVDYASREAAVSSARPQLLLVTLGAAPSISDIADLTVPVSGSTGPLAFTIGDADTSVGNLTVDGTSSNTNVVPDANIIFGGSGSNRTVTVTPTTGKSGSAIITITVSDNSGLSSSDTFTLTVSSHSPGTFVWNGPGAGANNWSASGNWLPAGPPEALDNVKFFDAGASGLTISNINNSVDASFGGEIASLQYANTNGNHATLINSGQALNILGAGGLLAGTETDNGSAQQVFATVTGAGGAVAVANASGNLIVRQGSATGGSQRATLDLSGLDEFDAAVSQILVGFAGPVIRSTGTLNLARTNNVTATGAPGICVGDNGSNGGGLNFLFLGQENSVFADSIVIGRRKAVAMMKFRAGLVNPTAYFRAADGISPIGSWSMGDGAILNASTSSSIGTNDFSGGTIDALVNTLTVGRSQQTSGANGTGALTFTAGTFGVNTLQIGFQTQAGSSAGIGFVTLNGPNALLNVNNVLLGACGGAVSTNVTRGVLNVFGGTAGVNSIAVGPGSGANLVAVNAGTLAITNTAGTSALPIDTVALTNASLQLFAAAGVTNIVASNLVIGGASNVVNFAGLTGISGPGQFPLIKYSGAINGAGFNFKLGTFPPGVVAGAYLSNNAVNSSIDLVITNLIVPDPFLTWDGTVSGDWDAETGNWKNNVQGGLVYADGEDVVFNDSATGPTVVNLTDSFTPGSVTVSNNVDAYVFTGAGNLSGTMALAKKGPGILMLANSGSNDFAGDVTIGGGVLWVGDGITNGNLPAANSITNNGALVFNRGDNIAVPNTIFGSGRLTNSGTGVLTLSGANIFSGGITVNAGTVRPTTATALGIGAAIVNAGNLVAAAAHTNAITLAGGTLGTAVTFTNTHLTAVAGTTSWVSTADPQNPSASLNLYVGGALHGSGTIVVMNATNVSSVDGGQGFRLIGTNASDFTGTVVLSNNVKGEMQIVTPGTFSPGGAGGVVLNCGNFYGTNGLLAPTTGGYSEFNLRNNSSGDGVLGNNVELAGNGLAALNALGTAPVGAKMTMGNLKMGGGQELAVYLSGGNTHVIAFSSVTLTGGDARFSPKPPTFGSAAQVGSDLTLGPISELTPGSGIIMSGLRTLTLSGSNTYSGGTLVNSGVLALTNAATISSSTNIVIAVPASVNVSGRVDGALTLAAGQTLQGVGLVIGNLTNGAGAMVSPGIGTMGTLVVSGSTTLLGTTRMELNRATATNDVLQVGGTLNYGGTLALANPGGALIAGDSFKMFNAAFYAGAFAMITPATPGPGLIWDTSQLAVNGTLKVAVAPAPFFTTMTLAGTNAVFSGTNGPRDGIYWVRASTNIALPVNAWPVIGTNSFDSNGGFGVTNPIDPAANQLFYLLQLQ
jgi:autotransporter-associated beta strand protein